MLHIIRKRSSTAIFTSRTTMLALLPFFVVLLKSIKQNEGKMNSHSKHSVYDDVQSPIGTMSRDLLLKSQMASSIRESDYLPRRKIYGSNKVVRERRKYIKQYRSLQDDGNKHRNLGNRKVKYMYNRKKAHTRKNNKAKKSSSKASLRYNRWPSWRDHQPHFYKYLSRTKKSSKSSKSKRKHSKRSKSSKKHTPKKGGHSNTYQEDFKSWFDSMSFQSSPTESPTQSPEESLTNETTPSMLDLCEDPAKRKDIIFERLEEISGDTMLDDTTPQGKAAFWITNEDDINQCSSRLVQRYGLAVFYFATNGENWNTSTRWLTTESECSWFSIICVNGEVTEIGSSFELDTNGLSGFLPPEIGLFTKLELFRISNNAVSSPIPEEIGNLAALQTLDLESNFFSSSIPDSLYDLVNLEFLLLGMNLLDGDLDEDIGKLQNLRFLSLAENNLDSVIPERIGELVNIEFLYLYGNSQFENILPEGIGNMRNLIELRVEDNRLNGNLPESIFRLDNLQIFFMQNNDFDGPIPDVLGFENLREFNASNNRLTGSLPQNTGGWNSLTKLDLNSNSLSNGIPTGLYDKTSLLELYLHNNSISGQLDSLDGWPNAQKIWLKENEFEETIPPVAPGTLENLEELLLNSNSFTGDMPDSICTLDLEDLWADCLNNDPIECPTDCCTQCF